MNDSNTNSVMFESRIEELQTENNKLKMQVKRLSEIIEDLLKATPNIESTINYNQY